MRIHHLALEGIGPYAERQELDFDLLSSGGLFLLTGPTGAGKTTILDAIVYALYGTVPGVRGVGSRGDRATSERIVSDLRAVDAQPQAELEFTVSGRRLRIARIPQHLRPKARGEGLTVEKGSVAMSELVEGSWVPRSANLQEVGDEVLDLLGMNAAQFAQVVLLPQGEFAGFLRASVTDRQKVLERLFQVDRYQSAEEWFEERAKEARARLVAAQGELRVVVDQLAGALGPVAGEPPPEHTLEEIDRWVGERRFEAEEVQSLARVAADAAGAARASAERSVRRTEELLARTAARDARAATIGALGTRVAGARVWIAANEDAALAEDESRWPGTARTAQEQLTRLQERQGDGLRARELGEQAAGAEAAAETADQGALAAEARVQALAPQLRAAQEEAGRADVADETLVALQRERERIATALQSARRRDALALERDAARQTASAAHEALAGARSVAEGMAPPAAAEAQLAATTDALARLEVTGAERRSARDGIRTEVNRLGDALDRAATLRAQHAEASAQQSQINEAWQQAREAHLAAREARLDAMAAELATTLDDDAPCPVCGSTDHPAPAQPASGGDLRAAEAAAEGRAAAARAALDRSATVVASIQGQLEALGAPADLEQDRLTLRAKLQELDAALAQDVAQHAELRRRGDEQRAALAASRAAVDALAGAERAEAEARHRVDVIASSLAAAIDAAGPDSLGPDDLALADTELERLRARRDASAAARDRVTALEADLERARHEAGALRERAASARASARAAREQAAGISLRLAELVAPHAGFDAALQHATRRASTLALAVEVASGHATARAELEAAEGAVAEAAAADPALADEPADPAARLAARKAAVVAAEAAREEAAGRQRDADRHVAAITHASDQLAAAREALGPAAEEAERLQRLDATVRGLGDNRRRISLTTYVLAARLEEVASAATAHLQRMSGGRYSLVHHDERFGNGPAGLGLRVLDAHSGEERDTATLSGGEAFYASLSLALGLADVVQREAGGRPLETLLVDEGFGSLDSDTLEEVLGELDELRAAGRAIGLVSHVPALAERIPAQLRVTPSSAGSHAEVVVGSVSHIER